MVKLVPLGSAPSSPVSLALAQALADVGSVRDLLLVEHALRVLEFGDHGDPGFSAPWGAADLDRVNAGLSVVDVAVFQVDCEGSVVSLLDAVGVDEHSGSTHGAGHQGDAVGADDEDAVGALRLPPGGGLRLALTRLGSFGPRALGALGLAACDRPYRAGARAADGRPPGQSPGAVIRLRMQRSELAVRGQPRYPDVRFVDRCHCCCSLTWVQPAG